MKSKRILAGVLAGVMVFGSSLTAFATEDAETGSWVDAEGTLNIPPVDVISVKVPTSAAFDFDIDGSKLLNGSDSTTYADATLLFKNTADGSIDGKDGYSSTSDYVKVENFSTIAVTVTFTGKVDMDTNGAIATGSGDISGSESAPTLYLAMVPYTEADGTFTAGNAVVLDADGVNLEGDLESDADEYESAPGTTDEETGKNQWTQTRTGTEGKDPFYFVLTGNASATSSTIDWDSLAKAPSVSFTYKITDENDEDITDKNGAAALSITLSGTYSRANTANVFTLSGLGDATVEKVEALNSEGEVFAEITSAMYTLDGSSLKVNGTTAPWGAGAVGAERGIRITLSDGRTVQTTFTVTA